MHYFNIVKTIPLFRATMDWAMATWAPVTLL